MREYRVRQGRSKIQLKNTFSSLPLRARGLIWPGPPKKYTECIHKCAPKEWKAEALVHMFKCPLVDVILRARHPPHFQALLWPRPPPRDDPGEESRKAAQWVLEVGS